MLKKIRSVAIYVVCCVGSTVTADALAVETGLASYYSDKFQGRKTASGEQYDRNKLTAAHRTLPIGSQIEVVNLKNHSSVIVTVNDRGPYTSNRKLDLSYAAAKELGLVAAGVGAVSFNVLGTGKSSAFEKAIPSEELFEFNQLAKAEEVEEAEEETVEPEPMTVAAASETTKADFPSKRVKVKKDSKNAGSAGSNKPEHQVKSEKTAAAKKAKSASVSKPQDKDSSKSEKTGKMKKTAKADLSKSQAVTKTKTVTKKK